MQTKNTLILLARASAVLFLALAAGGCAFVDQKVDLSYQRTVNASGGSGEVFIAKPKEYHGLRKKSNSWVIGTVKNTYGMKTADVVTENDIGDWIVGALVEELSAAGYRTRTVTALPKDVSKGLDLTIVRVFVDQDPGFFTVGAISDVQFTVEIWRNGTKLKQLNIVAKGDHRSGLGSAKTKAISLRKALQAAMLEAVPEIIKTLEN
jgi:putative transposon-encoded protein